MRKVLYLTIFFFISLLMTTNVNAEDCADNIKVKLNAELYNVKFNYEVVEATSKEDLELYRYPINDYVKVTVINITEGMAVVMDDGFEEAEGSEGGGAISASQKFEYSDTNEGVYTFNVPMDVVHNFEVFITNANSECIDPQTRKLTFITPRYNQYSSLEECKGVSEYYCDKYLTSEIPYSKAEIIKSIERLKKDDNTQEVQELSFFQKYGKTISLVIIGIFLVPIMIVACFVIRNYIRRRSIK